MADVIKLPHPTLISENGLPSLDIEGESVEDVARAGTSSSEHLEEQQNARVEHLLGHCTKCPSFRQVAKRSKSVNHQDLLLVQSRSISRAVAPRGGRDEEARLIALGMVGYGRIATQQTFVGE